MSLMIFFFNGLQDAVTVGAIERTVPGMTIFATFSSKNVNID